MFKPVPYSKPLTLSAAPSEHMNKLKSRLQYEKAKEAFFMRLLLLALTLATLTFIIL
jgi:hypothetical protein